MLKLIPLSRIKGDTDDIDSVRHSKRIDSRHRGYDILMQAWRYHANMQRFREERERNKRYTYGDQWGDTITDERGHRVKEETYIRRQGSPALKQNLIRRLVRNVVGVFRSQEKEPTCTARDRDEQKLGETMSTLLQYVEQVNKMTKLNARALEELLISGLVVHKKTFGWRNNRQECWTENVQPSRFFIDNNMRDPRGWDASCVGEIHDVPFDAVITEFARSADDYATLKAIYRNATDRTAITQNLDTFGVSNPTTLDFFLPDNPLLCRVVEIWRKETKPRYRCIDYNNGSIFKVNSLDEQLDEYDGRSVNKENQHRRKMAQQVGMPQDEIPFIETEWFIDSYWYYYFLTPFGDILAEGETPYAHGEHPYVWEAYPFIDGEIHSFVADVIDQQRYTNRLITLYDFIMRASAKGILLWPEGTLPDGYAIEDIAEEWHRYNGILMYKPKAGVPIPQQIAANSTNIGITELLNIQLKFFEDISGVHGALQGKSAHSSTSGTLYAQQAQNATTSLLDILDTMSEFIVAGAYKDVSNIQQFYDDRKIDNIAGRDGKLPPVNPDRVRNVEFDLSITESQTTPAYRQAANQFLLQLWQAQAITVEQLLEHGDFPFGDALLQSIRSQKQQVAEGQQPQPISPHLRQQAQQGANMDAVNQIYQNITT